MEPAALPQGKYLSATINIHPDFGGQTRALLMRNRIFAAHGVDCTLMMVGGAADMDWRRQTLRERGLLTEGIDLLNIYEHYRDTDWPGEDAKDEVLPDLGKHLTEEAALPDGSPWRRVYELVDGRTIYDYQRPDGSTFLRIPAFEYGKPQTWPTRVSKVARDGRVVGHYPGAADWYRRWLRDVAAGERSFVFLDSRYMATFVAPMKAPNINLIYLFHNVHVAGERRWDSPTWSVFDRVLDMTADFDAVVTLTQRQQDDVATRVGRTSNLFVVPNPVDSPEPVEVARDPRLVSVVARIGRQKRLGHALRVMAQVVRRVPDARLEIYGTGTEVEALQSLARRLGIERSVIFKGHDPHARESLWRSSAFLMTSSFEGYPLSTLESLSHGCPVVSYDIKYGPREQITDGVDGFLVPSKDIDAMADRVVRLLEDPALVRRMSEQARAKAAAHGYDRFMADWRDVLTAVIEAKPARTVINDARIGVRKLRIGRRIGPGRFSGRRQLRLDATVHVDGTPRERLGDATLTLAAIHQGSGLVVDVPVDVTFRDGSLRLRAKASLGDLFPSSAAEQDRCRLRVVLVWNNACWQTFIRRPEGGPSGLEVDFDSDDEWTLVRR